MWSDSCPPAITAVSLLSEAPNEEYQRVVDDVLQYLRVDAPRTDAGGISHADFLGARAIWVDSVFMFGMVLTRWGEPSDDASALDLMSEQMAIFAPRLQHENGLMQHADGWICDRRAERRRQLRRGGRDLGADRNLGPPRLGLRSRLRRIEGSRWAQPAEECSASPASL